MKARLVAKQWTWRSQGCRFHLFRKSGSTSIRSFSNSPSIWQEQEQIRAAPPIDFDKSMSSSASSSEDRMRYARIVPVSPSYFTAKPDFVDSVLELQELLRKYQVLPTLTPAAAPRASWKTIAQFRNSVGEPVKAAKYKRIVELLRRLNRIHPALMPQDVVIALNKHRRAIDPGANKAKPGTIDEFGRAAGAGRRKTSSARVLLVEGDGEVLINGQSINAAFGRIHDRESALWALKATGRLDKYNVWALVQGGGMTGQAEAITLAIAKALLVHEPALKAVLRRAGVITRDPRKVERKKPGKLKARKMPAWVKR